MLSGSLRRGPLTSGEGAAARTAGEVAELAGAYFERGVGGLRSTFDKAPSNLRGLWTGVVRGGSSPQEDDQPGARGPSSRSDAADATSQSLGLMMETADDDDDVEDQEGTEDDFRERVAWQSKYDAKTCFACGSAFNPITNRHHHCRACGRVVCGACSDHKDRVRGYSKPQRTCDECHESIQSEVSVNKLFMALCPCLKLFKKEIKRQRSAALLYEGAVFIKQRDLKSMSKNLVSGLFSKGSSGSSEDAGGDGPGSPSFSRQRVKVKLRNDGLALSVAPVAGGDDDDGAPSPSSCASSSDDDEAAAPPPDEASRRRRMAAASATDLTWSPRRVLEPRPRLPSSTRRTVST
mmetsp:Transcript_10429/g.42161  ORF Transcript_10429/g.42161 Transcript_10429/m.42161 type:complete len:350 (-) Transcript_10429:1465-2514(-)